MSPIDWAMRPLQKYATFAGRAPRAEYWWFQLLRMAVLIGVLTAQFIVSPVTDYLFMPVLTDSPSIMELWPTFVLVLAFLGSIVADPALAVRRLHDTDRSAWWLLGLLVPGIGTLALFVLAVIGGTVGPNRFGEDPYGESGTGIKSAKGLR